MREDARTYLKAAVLLLVLVCSFFALRTESARAHLTPEALTHLLDSVGPWGPVVFVILFALLAALPFPGSLLVIVGGAIFGFWQGLLLSFLGVLLSATLAFLLARTLGRDFTRTIAGDTLRRYDDKLSKDGFRTVLYLRLLLVPFSPVNYASGLSGIRLREYFLATAIGTIPATLFLTFFVATVRDVVLTHGMLSHELLSALVRWDVMLAAILLLACFSIPHIARFRSTRKRSRKK